MKRPIAEILDQLTSLMSIRVSRPSGGWARRRCIRSRPLPTNQGSTVHAGFRCCRQGQSRRHDVVGVPDPDKLQSDLASQCASTFNRSLATDHLVRG